MLALRRTRSAPWGLLAWVLPAVLLAASLAPAAAMFCRMRDAVVASACCCGAATAPAAEGGTATLEQQACCEAREAHAVRSIATRTEATPDPAPAMPLAAIVVVLDRPAPPSAASARDAATPGRDPGRRLVLLKHALLV